MKRTVLICLMVLEAVIAQGQIGWTLKACIDTGIQRNISLQQSEVGNNINGVNLKQSKDNLFPSFNITDGPGFNFGKIQGASGSYAGMNTVTNSFALTGSVTLYNGLQYQNTINENDLVYKAGLQNIETIKDNISLNILSAYMLVLANYEGVEIAVAQIKSDSVQVNQAKIYVQAGKYPELNLLQVQSQLATDKLAKVSALNQLLLAKVNLMQLMNIPVNYNFEVYRPTSIDSLLTVTALVSSDIYKVASGFLPQVKNAELNTQVNQYAYKVAQSYFYPKLTMTGNIKSSASSLGYTEYYNEGTIGFTNTTPMVPVTGYIPETSSSNNLSNLWQQFNFNFSQFLGLNLTIPLFTNFYARNSVEVAKLNIQNAQLNEESVKVNLRQTIEQAYTNLLASAEQYNAAKEALASEERTFTDMQKKFNIGLESATNYLVEQANYTKALQNVTQAKFNYLLQVKVVDFYLGKPIIF